MFKKLIYAIFISSLSCLAVMSNDSLFPKSNFSRAFEPRCTKKQTICTMGKFKIKDKKGVYINNGVICNSKKTRCTNGVYYVSSNKPLY